MADLIDPKLLQTLYQITIHGLKDLPLAPNPYVGFVMTVIRLMNFMPNNNPNNASLEMLKETQPKPWEKTTKTNLSEEPEKKNSRVFERKKKFAVANFKILTKNCFSLVSL